MTNHLPQVIAEYITPSPPACVVTVTENEKAVIIDGGKTDGRFSGGTRQVLPPAKVVVASLQDYHMVIGFGDSPESQQAHAWRQSLHTSDGEEIRCLTATIQFALDKDDLWNVDKLMQVAGWVGGEITVTGLAANMDISIQKAVQNAVAHARRSSGSSLKTDYLWITAIELGSQPSVEREFLKYGLSVKGVHLNVVDGSTVCPPLELHVDGGKEPQGTSGTSQPPPPPPLPPMSLHDAACSGETETALRLIATGADIDAQDGSDNTPLRCAIINHKTETAIALIAAGADIYIRYKGNTPLHTAEWCDEINVALALIAADKNVVDVQNWWWDTPLHSAVINDHIEVVRVLKDAGANLNVRNKARNTPLGEAIKRGITEIEQVLRDSSPPPTPEEIAARAGIPLNDKYGNTPLHIAAWRGETEIALRLIIAGADRNVKNKYDATPLRVAIRNDKTETALALIAARADIRAKDGFNFMPIHTVAWRGDVNVALALIAASGVDAAYVNAKGRDDWTPLHAAAADAHTRIALDLIAAGADAYVMDYHGNTPIQAAADKNYVATAEAMIAAAQRRR